MVLILSHCQKTIDKDIEKLRNHLQDTMIPGNLGQSKIYKYCIPWLAGGGVQPSTDSQHAAYIRQFGHDFVSSVLSLIDAARSRKEADIPTREYYRLVSYVLSHIGAMICYFGI